MAPGRCSQGMRARHRCRRLQHGRTGEDLHSRARRRGSRCDHGKRQKPFLGTVGNLAPASPDPVWRRAVEYMTLSPIASGLGWFGQSPPGDEASTRYPKEPSRVGPRATHDCPAPLDRCRPPVPVGRRAAGDPRVRTHGRGCPGRVGVAHHVQPAAYPVPGRRPAGSGRGPWRRRRHRAVGWHRATAEHVGAGLPEPSAADRRPPDPHGGTRGRRCPGSRLRP